MLDISWDRLFSQTQLPFKYNSVIDRHGQWFRWLRGITCPCITTETAQPNINCTLCKGEGRIYKNPLNMLIYNESAKHDGTGRVYRPDDIPPDDYESMEDEDDLEDDLEDLEN